MDKNILMEHLQNAHKNHKSLHILSKEIDMDCSYLSKVARKNNLFFSKCIKKSNPIRRKLIGKKFGMLTVISLEDKGEKGGLWKCECECGNTKIVHSQCLRKGNKSNVQSCGCLLHKRGSAASNWRGYGELPAAKWYSINKNAKTRNLEFSISIKDAYDIFVKQDRKCALTGEELTMDNKDTIKKVASLDRIDSSKGYIKGNVQWINKHINFMKASLNELEFIKICMTVSDYYKKIHKIS
jgi:hypothetical protein